MESCTDLVGLILAEANYRLLLGVAWLDDTVRIIDSVGLTSHLAGYSAVVFMVFIVIYVWRMTRNRAPMHH